MRFNLAVLTLAVLLGGASSALAWNCPSGQIRQQAPAGTPTTAPYYDVVEGIAFICVSDTPSTPTTTGSTSASTATASSNQSQNQNQQQVANGGLAQSSSTSAGGSATGGSSSAVGTSLANNGINQGTIAGQVANGGAGGSSSATGGAGGTGGTASATDNAKNTNTSSNTNVNAPVANGGAGGSVKDSGNSSSTATGGSVKDSGNSSSTVKDSGNSTIKDSGNSSSTSGVKNSGNSSNKNNNTNVSKGGNATGGTATGGNATGGQGGQGGVGGTATSQSVSGSSSAGSGNSTSISSNEQVNVPRQTPMAYAPDVLSTSPCLKGFSGGGSGPMGALSLGFSKVDKGCDDRQTAVIFHGLGNDYAAAKILCNTDAAKRAHLTLDDCARIVVPVAPVIIAQPVPQAPQPNIVINVPPTPAPVIEAAPVETPVPVSQVTAQEIGVCRARLMNECKRFADNAVLALQNNTATTLTITGPLNASRQLRAYLRNTRHISPSRVKLHIEDVNTVTFEEMTTNVE